MTTREMLHEIVDELPEEDLVTAVRILKGLELAPGSLEILLANAPPDDEPDDDDFDGGLTEAWNQARTGQTIPHEEVKWLLGIDE
jgi:hypothetical protein